MIVSKPKKQALFSLGVVILICLGLGSYNLLLLLRGSTWWFNYLMAGLLLFMGLLLLFRQLLNYKIISLGDNKLQVWHPLRFRVRRWPLKELAAWEEVIIQTRTGMFRQLELDFPGYRVKLNNQEFASYYRILAYMQKKLPRKRRK